MNSVALTGRLTRDPDIRQSAGSKSMAIARFTLAINRRYKADEEANADFISCIAFGKTAEFVDKYVKKGTKLEVTGHIQTGKYTNQQGTTIYTTDVVCDNVEFAESKGKKEENASSNEFTQEAPIAGYGEFMQINFPIEEELPFN